MMEKVYVFGHKKPDTDSVCASITLSYLKNKLGLNTTPRVLGSINNETKFVLDYFKFDEPKYLNDVKVQIKDMEYNKEAMINEYYSIADTFNMMNSLKVTGLPIIDNNKYLVGYVNLKEISKYLLGENINVLNTSYDNIVKVLDGKSVLKFDDEIKGTVIASAYKSSSFIKDIKLDSTNILLAADRNAIVEYAIDSKVKLIVIIGDYELDDELINKARKNKVNIIYTKYDTFMAVNKIKVSNYVKNINVTKTPITFKDNDFRDDFVEIANKYGHTNYPVVDKNNKCVGMLRLVDSNNYKKKSVILVDHNQLIQSVEGLEQAEIIEIVDHHNLGTIGTNNPINFRSMPVGCTNTLIYLLYKESNVEIPNDIAGLMLSAILSDTLLLKSPTTTKLDIEVANKLAAIAGVDITSYGIEMIKAGSSIKGLSSEEVVFQDFKEFKYEDIKIGIGQVNTLDIDEILKDKNSYINVLNKMEDDGYKISLLFITDVIKNGSYILYNGNSKDIVSACYKVSDIEEGKYLDGVVSRKKQMLPLLLEYLER